MPTTQVAVPLGEPEAVGVSDVGLSRLDAHLLGYIERGQLPGSVLLLARKGQIVHLSTLGLADCERGTPSQADTIFRIYSMSKPVTSVALMQLYEQGKLQLDDPVAKYIPSWSQLRVYESGDYPHLRARELRRAVTVRDLLSHQAGLGYGRPTDDSPIDRAYAAIGVLDPSSTLETMVEKIATVPLLFAPGEHWKYSVAADVCGHLVQRIADQPFDDYLAKNIFEPLGMADTAFWVQPDRIGRFAANYTATAANNMVLCDDPLASPYAKPATWLSGGGGLTSTVIDYWRFAQALCNGGQMDGQRIIGRKTLELMTRNHLTGGADLASIALGRWSETTYQGIGFGLGFSVTLDPVMAQISGTAGEYSWGGAASTTFLVDPAEDLVFIFMTQLIPSWHYNLRRELRALLYACVE